MTGACTKCGYDYAQREYRACCGLLWAVCQRCKHGWTELPLDHVQHPEAKHDVSPDSLMRALMSLERSAPPDTAAPVTPPDAVPPVKSPGGADAVPTATPEA